MHEALKFTQFVKEQMGVEIFMLAGWQDEKGLIKKTKCFMFFFLKGRRFKHSIFSIGSTLLDHLPVASRICSIRWGGMFGKNGILIWGKYGIVSESCLNFVIDAIM
jgi:hypothetical protein